jgi:GntR family transcriptional regulator
MESIQSLEGLDDRLDSGSPVPLYFQLQELIRKKIESGEYEADSCIPSEAELQKKYRVSRITVRNAIEGLVFEELLFKKQGVGTIVARRRFVDDTAFLKSFTEKSLEQHADARTEVLEIKRIGASRRIADHLGVAPEESVVCVKRLRYIDSEPINLFTSYIRGDLGLSLDHDFSGSLYRLLEEHCGIRINEAEKVIEAIPATPEEAEILGVSAGDSLLVIRNTTFDTEGRAVEYAEGLYRSDRYKYVVRLKR